MLVLGHLQTTQSCCIHSSNKTYFGALKSRQLLTTEFYKAKVRVFHVDTPGMVIEILCFLAGGLQG